MNSFDAVVIGAGPAGSAAAIQCASAGLKTVIVERERFPRDRPGETLHPGIQPLLDQLGIRDLPFPRHAGHWVEWGGPARFERFGADERGPWLGYNAWRADFDTHLLRRAREAGAELRQPLRATKPLVNNGRVMGIRTSDEELHCKFLIDASGGRHYLARHLNLPVQNVSPKLTAVYHYAEGNLQDGPRLTADPAGWTWKAEVREGLVHCTKLRFENSREVPAGSRRSDVTWRRVERVAGPGYFIVGDAASVLDPASSHGVLKAVMSGMQAGFLIGRYIQEGIEEAAIVSEYNRWISTWFRHDVRRLRQLYSQHPNPPHWLKA